MAKVSVIVPPLGAREKFIEAVLALEGKPVVWGGLDCSEAVAIGVKAAGGPDQSKTHRAQTYFDETRPLLPKERALPGDLVFYGTHPADPTTANSRVIHVGVILPGGKVLSADGATSRVTDPAEAARNPAAKVTIHETVYFRRDALIAIHRNTVVDSIDFVTR